jgi:hypothetical protein
MARAIALAGELDEHSLFAPPPEVINGATEFNHWHLERGNQRRYDHEKVRVNLKGDITLDQPHCSMEENLRICFAFRSRGSSESWKMLVELAIHFIAIDLMLGKKLVLAWRPSYCFP